MGTPLKVFVFHRQPVMRHGLKAMVGAAPALQWVGEAEDIDATLRGIAALPPMLEPDVLLLEPATGCPKAAAVSALDERLPRLACLVVCDSCDTATMPRIVTTGARGCLPRVVSIEDLQAGVEYARGRLRLARTYGPWGALLRTGLSLEHTRSSSFL